MLGDNNRSKRLKELKFFFLGHSRAAMVTGDWVGDLPPPPTAAAGRDRQNMDSAFSAFHVLRLESSHGLYKEIVLSNSLKRRSKKWKNGGLAPGLRPGPGGPRQPAGPGPWSVQAAPLAE